MAKARKARIRICREEGCQNAQTTGGYCRLHYLRNWRKIKVEQQRGAAKRLNSYIERMSRQFPDRFVDEIKKDLRARSMESMADDPYSGDDDLVALFNDVSYDEDVDRLIKDLKIEKEF